ncbi:MAG TPA: ribosome small subunit-dependent GTPase A [Vicinamibacterales bacterium]|nr:ribosome small subunit-dependent GTPase A [Vicinamibacterales bacterium]
MSFELKALGWDDEWERVFAPYAQKGLVPARVAIEFNYIYRLYATAGELQGQHAGRLRHEAVSKEQLSAVGDWVAILPTPGEATATIEAVLPRRTKFSRKVAGEITEEQVVAANIDVVFIVMGLDGDYNPRRLERYLLLARESGARPVVILNKSDVATHLADDLNEIGGLAVGVPVHAISAKKADGVNVIYDYLGPGRTAALLGSSGVGKSTLVNALLGTEMLKTRDVREHDSRGRHTTRHRHLILLPDARGLLIDTPGMRELQLWTQTETARDTFEDIVELSAGCHFTDCRHMGEPRCAVKQAVEGGTLDAARLEGFLKLQDEVQTLEARKDVRAQINAKKKSKTISQSIKKLYKDRDRE